MKQFPYCRPTNIRPHRKKSYSHGYLAPGICAPLLTCASFLNEDVKQPKVLYCAVLSAQMCLFKCYCVSKCRLSADVFPAVQNTLIRCGSVILHNGCREKRRSATFDFEIQFVCEKFRSVKNTNIDRFIDTSVLSFLFGSKE